MEADEAKNKATSEALEIVARAQENADETIREAADAALKTRSEADEKARELMREARQVAGDVRADGARARGATSVSWVMSLRNNAERLLHDVQGVHSTFLSQIDKVDPSRSQLRGLQAGSGRRSSTGAGRLREADSDAGDDLDVPEFIPRGG